MISLLDRWLIICVAATASLGALLLGLGQQNLSLAVVAAFCATASAISTDYLKWFHFPRWLAGPLAIAAVFYGFYRFSVAEPGNQLLVIADLLVYLQLVLFFQQKNPRVYWHILLLSLFQVVVSAALNLYVAFGGLVIVYLFLVLASATLLFFRDESEWHGRISMPRAQWPRTGNELSQAWQQYLFNRREADRSELGQLGIVVYSERREDVDEGVNLSLVRYLTRFGLLTLLLTSFMFFMFPRFSDSGWQASQQTAAQLVGYSGNVELSEFGEIHESEEEVMRVRFTNAATDEPAMINSEPYFRGDALTHYQPVRGKWAPRMAMPELRLLQAPPKEGATLVRQTVSLESKDHMFSVVPIYRGNSSADRLRLESSRNVLVRDTPPGWDHDDVDGVNSKRYEILTSAFRFGMQRPITPEFGREVLSKRELAELTRINRRRFPELTRIADETLEGTDPLRDVVKAARRLESHFRGSSYSYSLNLANQPPRGIDPIEYFVTEHRQGHCEYFASALALMCRSQGIPARLVVGYRGGDYNTVGQYYLVRELHAHAWVEVYLRPDQIPELAVLESESVDAGAWLRLDPTPGSSSDPTPVRDASWLGQVSQFQDFLELLWRDYVVGLNAERQRQIIYGPIVGSIKALFVDALFNPEWWAAFGETLSQRMGLGSWETFRERWLTWRTIPFLAVTSLVIYVLYRLGRWSLAIARWMIKRFSKQQGSSWSHSRQLEFFRRLERLAEKLQIRRSPGQTHLEMAMEVAAKLSDGMPNSSVNATTSKLVDAFYRVRFGKQRLSAPELGKLDVAVRQLWTLVHKKSERQV